MISTLGDCNLESRILIEHSHTVFGNSNEAFAYFSAKLFEDNKMKNEAKFGSGEVDVLQ